MAYKRKKQILKILKRSCITNKIVWLGHERSYKAGWETYKNACKREKERIRNWSKMVELRKSNIMRMLSDCLSGMSITDELTPEKRQLANQMVAMTETDTTCDRDFYDHILQSKKKR